jgi:DNA-binding beta-propeller fold protein YncE
LTVIDGQSRQIIATIALGKRPRGIAADARHQRLFVALSGSSLWMARRTLSLRK